MINIKTLSVSIIDQKFYNRIFEAKFISNSSHIPAIMAITIF